jgi:ABC-type thiamin/hydroxymethylpyrimidine transport system permease subunit
MECEYIARSWRLCNAIVVVDVRMQQGVRYLYFGHLHASKSTITVRMLQELDGDILRGITCMEGVNLLGYMKDLTSPIGGGYNFAMWCQLIY